MNAHAQVPAIYNLNINNGLPTNYAYCICVDHHGYLWIATTRGVVRYNGYESKLYNYSSGLPYDEVWRLYEDKRHRLWFSAISPFAGYVYNNKFKAVYNTSNSMLYPVRIADYDSGVFFVNSGTGPAMSLCYERNDTIYTKPYISESYAIHSALVKDKDAIILTKTNKVFYRVKPDFKDSSKAVYSDVKLICEGNNFFNNHPIIYKNQLVSYARHGRYFATMNIDTCKKRIIDFHKLTGTNEDVNYLFTYDDGYYGMPKLCVVGDRNIFELDDDMKIRHQYSIRSSSNNNIDGSSVSFFGRDTLWNKYMATRDRGVFIKYGDSGLFRKEPQLDLSDYKFAGQVNDSTCFWWNDGKDILTKIVKNENPVLYRNSMVKSLNGVVSYNPDSALLLCASGAYWLNVHNGHATEFFKNIKWTLNSYKVGAPISLLTAYIYNKSIFYFLTKYGELFMFNAVEDSLTARLVVNSNNRYDGLTYDKVGNNLWVYNSYAFGVYKNGVSRIHFYQGNELRKLKIKNIESVIADTLFGNIFLKEYDRLLLFDSGFSYHPLFPNLILDGAQAFLHNNYLVVAGRFGVLFCKIIAKGKLSPPVVYQNVKGIAYSYVSDAYISDNRVLINTDKGVYTAKLPADSVFDRAVYRTPAFNLIVTYNDELIDIKGEDTIGIQQKDMKLLFDVINPAGNGAPHYKYFIRGMDTTWHELNANELLLKSLRPGRYYSLSIIVNDNSWRSNEMSFTVFIVPYWWQKEIWQRTFWIGGFMLVCLFGLAVAYITRRIVHNKNIQKNLRLELELKAIYSQINPHFIYNTLNSALLLISEENTAGAYQHISKFSKLLRAYVRSSRNKYITIEDEINNLRNYIELQQTRFKDRFDYSISIDEEIRSENPRIPSLLLQPFVENAITHGLLPRQGKGTLSINIKRGKPAEIICIIDDDGIGRGQAASLNEENAIKKESYGSDMIKDLVSIFNKFEKMNITIGYTDKKPPQSGTIVEITIKKQL